MTPSTTGYSFGDVVLVPFPFTDQSNRKKRPAAVISSDAYHQAKPDLIIIAVTSQVKPTSSFGEVTLRDWQGAGCSSPRSSNRSSPPSRKASCRKNSDD